MYRDTTGTLVQNKKDVKNIMLELEENVLNLNDIKQKLNKLGDSL